MRLSHNVVVSRLLVAVEELHRFKRGVTPNLRATANTVGHILLLLFETRALHPTDAIIFVMKSILSDSLEALFGVHPLR